MIFHGPPRVVLSLGSPIAVAVAALLGATSLASCENPNAEPGDDYVGCRFERKNTLPIDCRCDKNKRDTANCGDPQDLPGGLQVGQGPSLLELSNTRWQGGEIDPVGRVVYAAIGWTDPGYSYRGLVMAFDLETGNRRVVSGEFPTESGGLEYGTGVYLPSVMDIRLGSDGKLYAWCEDEISNMVIRIDPETGNRDLRWREHDPLQVQYNVAGHDQCPNGFKGPGGRRWIQTWDRGFALDADDNFIVSVVPNAAGENMTPSGIVRITNDGARCEWVSRAANAPNNDFVNQDIGKGPMTQHAFQVLMLDPTKTKIWALDSFLGFFIIDLATGDRIGRSPAGAPGESNFTWDPGRELIWSGGSGGPMTMIAGFSVDMSEYHNVSCVHNDPDSWFGCAGDAKKGPAGNCCQGRQFTWYDPVSDKLIMAHRHSALVAIDLHSGASMLISQ